MVAKIITGKSLSGALNYNEKKVASGKADLLFAAHYPKDKDRLSFYDKLGMLQSLSSLNHRSKTNCVHLSLNFDPSERLSKTQLIAIADTYMHKIGFCKQPFLVYEHLDAGHSHIHIVTTNIQKDGSRIELHNIGKTLSEKARKEIEKQFNLVPAESKSQKQLYSLKPVALQKAVYGKSETKRAITNIVREVMRNYRFTSLTELNAVLRQFNIAADQGKEGTKMRNHGGLHYSIIDEKGSLVGVPIKASSIYGNPTLKTLEEKFEYNQTARKEFKEGLKNILSSTLHSLQAAGKEKFIQVLKKEGINAVFHENAQGFIYGITYIDNVNRCVFKGSDLGKDFSAKALTGYLEIRPVTTLQELSPSRPAMPIEEKAESKPDNVPFYHKSQGEQTSSSYLPYELNRDKKKKKRKRKL